MIRSAMNEGKSSPLNVRITGKNLGMPAMIGVVMLMGLVTKNAILLVDYTNQLRGEGLSLKDARKNAGQG